MKNYWITILIVIASILFIVLCVLGYRYFTVSKQSALFNKPLQVTVTSWDNTNGILRVETVSKLPLSVNMDLKIFYLSITMVKKSTDSPNLAKIVTETSDPFFAQAFCPGDTVKLFSSIQDLSRIITPNVTVTPVAVRNWGPRTCFDKI